MKFLLRYLTSKCSHFYYACVIGILITGARYVYLLFDTMLSNGADFAADRGAKNSLGISEELPCEQAL